MNNDTLIPLVGIITDVCQDTPDVKTFRVNALDGGKVFEHMPGQCAMLSIPGVGRLCSLSLHLPQIRSIWSSA